MARGYSKVNRLRRIIKIQELTIEHQKNGATIKWIFENVIEPNFFISDRTYSEYLGINAKAELKKIRNDAKNTEKQKKTDGNNIPGRSS